MIAPPIGYGASGEHESFSGTVSIGSEALRLLLVESGRPRTGRDASCSSTDMVETLRRWPRRPRC
jgi:hypothetical protein